MIRNLPKSIQSSATWGHYCFIYGPCLSSSKDVLGCSFGRGNETNAPVAMQMRRQHKQTWQSPGSAHIAHNQTLRLSRRLSNNPPPIPPPASSLFTAFRFGLFPRLFAPNSYRYRTVKHQPVRCSNTTPRGLWGTRVWFKHRDTNVPLTFHSHGKNEYLHLAWKGEIGGGEWA